MILSEQIYKTVTYYCKLHNITPCFSDRVPDETLYPFTLFEITKTDPYPKWGFTLDLETISVRFNVYDDNYNPGKVIKILKDIEHVFDRTCIDFIDVGDGSSMCNKMVDNSLNYDNDEGRWLGIQDYEFVCTRVKGQDFESSSSSSIDSTQEAFSVTDGACP